MRLRCEDCEQKVPEHFCKLSQVCNICGNEDPPGFSFVDRKRFCDGDHFLMALQAKKDSEPGGGEGEQDGEQEGEPEDGEPQDGEGSEGDSEGSEGGDGDPSNGGRDGDAYEDSMEREGKAPQGEFYDSRPPLKATGKFDYSTLRDVVRNKQKEVKR